MKTAYRHWVGAWSTDPNGMFNATIIGATCGFVIAMIWRL